MYMTGKAATHITEPSRHAAGTSNALGGFVHVVLDGQTGTEAAAVQTGTELPSFGSTHVRSSVGSNSGGWV